MERGCTTTPKQDGRRWAVVPVTHRFPPAKEMIPLRYAMLVQPATNSFHSKLTFRFKWKASKDYGGETNSGVHETEITQHCVSYRGPKSVTVMANTSTYLVLMEKAAGTNEDVRHGYRVNITTQRTSPSYCIRLR